MNLLEKLNQPAPIMFNRIKLGFAIIVGLFIAFFLLIFQPFNFNNVDNKYLHSFGFGLISFTTYFLYQVILYFLYKKKVLTENHITLLLNIVFMIFLVLLISCANFIYSALFLELFSFNLESFLKFLIYTFAIGIFPSIFFSYLAYSRELKKNTTALSEISYSNKTIDKLELITFKSNIGNDEINIDSENIISAKSQGNYVELSYFDNTKTSKKLIRSTLKEIEKLLSKHKNFIKVHRSYIVNTELIEKSTGNSQGINLYIKNSDIVVPVSRNYVSNFK